VLHHVASPATAIREMARVLRPGGRLLIVEQVEHEHEAFAAEMGDRWWGFEPGQVERWVREAGVDDVRVRPLVTAAAAGDESAADAPTLCVVTGQAEDR
jgi:ArsR family transcriptional regulator